VPTLLWLPVSPFARFVYYFANAAGIKLDQQVVDLLNGEHKKPEFLAKNPSGKIPVLIEEDGFAVWESHAIVRYLAKTHPTSLYPQNDARETARIDRDLETIDRRFSLSSFKLFVELFVKKLFTGNDPDPEVVKTLAGEVTTHLKFIEENFFKESEHHVLGKTQTVVDIFFAIWLTQLSYVHFDFSPFPKSEKFFNAIKETEHYKLSHDAASGMVNSIVASKIPHLQDPSKKVRV